MADYIQALLKYGWSRSLVFGLLLYGLVMGVQAAGWLSLPEFTALNFAYSSRDDIDINDDIAFWNMNDEEVKKTRWPWSWSTYAELIHCLQEYEVDLVVFQEDTFSDPGLPALNKEEMDRRIEELADAMEDIDELKRVLDNQAVSPREQMVKNLETFPHTVFSQYFLIPDKQEQASVDRRTEVFKKGFIKTKREKIEKVRALGQDSEGLPNSLLSAINITPLDSGIAETTLGVGFSRILPDGDGVIRQAPTVVEYDGSVFFSRAIMAAAAYYDCPLDKIRIVPGRYLEFEGVPAHEGEGHLRIPIDAQGKMYVNWTQKDQLNAFGQVPFGVIKQLVVQEMCRELIKGRSYDPEDLRSFGPVFQQMKIDFSRKVDGFDPKDKGDQDIRVMTYAMALVIQLGMNEVLDLEELLDGDLGLMFKSRLAYFDADLMYQAIRMATILRMQWNEFEGEIPSFEECMENEMYALNFDRMLYEHLLKNFEDEVEILETLADLEWIVPDEDFSADTDSRMIIKHLDLSREKYLQKLAVAMGKSSSEMDENVWGRVYDLFQPRREFIKRGYEHAVYLLKKGNVEDDDLLYFGAPVFFNKKGEDYPYSLLDFKGKTAFLGLTATGLNALNPTPYVGRESMAAMTPTSFNTITTGQFIERFDHIGTWLTLIYIVVVMWAVFSTPFFVSLPLMVVMAFGHYWMGMSLLEKKGWILPLVIPVVGVLSSYLVANIYLYIEQRRERQKVRGMFAAMVSPEVLKIMEEEPDRFNLTGEKVEASMFSSDVSGFTSISEGVTAQELALILNLYLTPMSNLVMTYGGYVEKYEGDAIKADFGMPLPDSEHAWKACFSAILQQEELFVVQRMLQLKYGVMITARMGVNTGVVNAGNMGSEKKMQYCAIGEEVAMAEELEPSNKMWETWIAISPETLRLSGDILITRELDIVEYEYTTIPVYELLGWKEEAFLEFWKGKPIPALVIEGWERMIPEKVLAYNDYYHERDFKANPFFDLYLSSLESMETDCLEAVKLNDKLDIYDLEQRYQQLLKDVDAMGVVVQESDLGAVDAREMEGLRENHASAQEEWLKLLNGYLCELKMRTHTVTALADKVDQDQIDEWNTSIDTLEKNCNCYIKRNRFPRENDRYGLELKQHLVECLPNPTQGLGEEQLKEIASKRDAFLTSIKGKITQFVAAAKPLAEDYHVFMAQHGLVSDDKIKTCDIFAEGRELYLKKEWEPAREKFAAGLALVADDGPCMTFIDRCDKFEKEDPGEDWDGVWEADW